MNIKYTLAALAATTLAANAALTLNSLSSSGNTLTVNISGTLDAVGAGDDLGNRNLLFFADKRLGDGTTQSSGLGYDNWIGGASNGGHNILGSLGGVAVGAIQGVGGLDSGLTGSQTAIRRDGNDTSAGDVRGAGSSAGPVDYLVAGFGSGNGTYAALAVGTALDLTFTFNLGGGGIEKLDTMEKFTSAFALYANDAGNNEGINAAPANYNEITAVPEPSAVTLLGLGAFALLLRRRK